MSERDRIKSSNILSQSRFNDKIRAAPPREEKRLNRANTSKIVQYLIIYYKIIWTKSNDWTFEKGIKKIWALIRLYCRTVDADQSFGAK